MSEKDDSVQGVIVFNTLPWTRSEVIVSPEKKTKWVQQQYKDDYEYLLGIYDVEDIACANIIYQVENVPGLGASGYVESTSDFKAIPEEKSVKGNSAQDLRFFNLRNITI